MVVWPFVKNASPQWRCIPQRHPMISLNADILFRVLYAAVALALAQWVCVALTYNKVNTVHRSGHSGRRLSTVLLLRYWTQVIQWSSVRLCDGREAKSVAPI